MSRNADKTPVTILEEMKTFKPKYELVLDGGGTHTSVFKYRVTAGPYVAVGKGRSKKDAKHDAAQRALNLLAGVEVLDAKVSSATVEEHANPVGCLQQRCVSNELPLPEYRLAAYNGPPSARLFTIRCRVYNMEESGEARTKKMAKFLAAQAMLRRLEVAAGDHLATNLPESLRQTSFKRAQKCYYEKGRPSVTTRQQPLGLKLSEYHTAYRHLDCPRLRELKDVLQRPEELDGRPLNVLEALCDQLSIKLARRALPAVPKRAVVVVKLDTSPALVAAGQGPDEDAATQAAALRALRMLCTLGTNASGQSSQ